MSVVLLRAENIRFAYGEVAALDGVSLGLKAGEIVAVLGPNGSGKSTLLRVLLGHLSATADIGWNGKSLQAWGRRELAKLAAYLPQSPVWESGQSVVDALRLGRAPYWGPIGIESAADEQIVRKIADQLELGDLLRRKMDELSGGQRQRVLLGRALAQQPRAMLLDEPSTFLDLKHQMELGRLLRERAKADGIGMLLASHDLNLTAMFADTVLLLDRGRIAAAGAPADVLQPATLESVYGVAMERFDRKDGPPAVVPKMDPC